MELFLKAVNIEPQNPLDYIIAEVSLLVFWHLQLSPKSAVWHTF